MPANAAVHSAWGHQRKLRGAPNDTTATDVNGRVLKYGIQWCNRGWNSVLLLGFAATGGVGLKPRARGRACG